PFGETLLIDEMEFKLPPGGIIGVIGPNGAGKTTLFRMILGQEPPDAGTIRVGETVRLGYIDQNRTLDPDKSIFEEITGGTELVLLGPREMNARAYVARFNFSGSDQQKKVGVLSGGERNRVHLARMLKEGANVLLLDEPTNDLDVNTIRALEEGLENFAGCAVIISHDRWFLDRVATHILAFEGDSQVVFFEGNFEEYEKNKKQRLGVDADQARLRARVEDDARGPVNVELRSDAVDYYGRSGPAWYCSCGSASYQSSAKMCAHVWAALVAADSQGWIGDDAYTAGRQGGL